MKKWMSWMLAICMILSMSVIALAEGTQAQEMTAAAVVYDKDGAAVQVAEGGITLTDIAERTEGSALQTAYSNVMAQVHYADVKSGEGILADKINAVLTDCTAFDTIVTDWFEAALSAEYALTEGGYVDVTFTLTEDQQIPSLVAVSVDGIEWDMAQIVSVDGRNVTVRYNAMGVTAFIIVRDDAENEAEIPEGETAPEQNDKFTPSVSGKPAPGLVAADGDDYVAVIKTVDDEIGIPEGYLVITPLSERDIVTDVMNGEHLTWAYDSILRDEINTVELEAALTAMNSGLTAADMIIRDLFEATAYGEYVEKLYDENNYVVMTLDAQISKGTTLVVLYSSDSAVWQVLPAENVVINDNGTITVSMNKLGAIALMVDNAQVNAGTVMSPAMGN